MLDAFKTSAPNIPLTIIDPADNGVIMERAVDAAGEYVQSGDVVLMALHVRRWISSSRMPIVETSSHSRLSVG